MGKNSTNSRRLSSLVRRSDFQALRADGRTLRVNRWMWVNFRGNSAGKVRVGWTLPRYVGSAVIRNRLRRWGREFLRHGLSTEELELDLNIVLRRQDTGFYKGLSHEEFDEAMAKMVRELRRQPEWRRARPGLVGH